MKLLDALRFLAGIHTASTGGTGYAVNLGVKPQPGDLATYNESWGVVRDALADPPAPTARDVFDRLPNEVPNPELLNINIGADVRERQKREREYRHPWRKGG